MNRQERFDVRAGFTVDGLVLFNYAAVAEKFLELYCRE